MTQSKTNLQINSIFKYIARSHCLPFSTGESQNFTNFIENPDPKFQIHSRKHLPSKLIQTKYKDVPHKLCDNLQKDDHICLIGQ